MDRTRIENLARLVRYHILASTTAAGSGHPSSSLSAADILTALFFNYLRCDLDNFAHPNNDRVIFSKGHAAPLLYALFAAAGRLSEKEIKSLRKSDSVLEGHPTPRFPYVETATGSLGQGLSIGVGMALNARYLDKLPYKTYVLLGDGEMAEGSVWEACQIASYYKLDNLIAIIDVNRFGQSQETMYRHDIKNYAAKLEAFGWETRAIDGHSIEEIGQSFSALLQSANGKPKAIVAKTLKGKGVAFLEDKDGWHGKAVGADKYDEAITQLGKIDFKLTGKILLPENLWPRKEKSSAETPPMNYARGEKCATRRAYGNALARLVDTEPNIIALDGDTKNSTFSQTLLQKNPEHFFEMFIAEQNMIGVAVGLAKRGKIPFVSTFSAFLTRAFDQIRMAAVSEANVKCVGSHAGVSIGEDGASQMGLEDLAMFRAVFGSTVLYPSDAVSCERLVEASLKLKGVTYIRTNRPDTPILYNNDDRFEIGGSKTLKSSTHDKVTVVAAGVTLIEALKAYEELAKEGIAIRIIDCYSVKPIDQATLIRAAKETGCILVVEDHWIDGGIGDAVLAALSETKHPPIIKMGVSSMPRSATPAELLDTHGISAKAIVAKIRQVTSS